MSCYEWESGEFHLPVAEYKRVKKAFREAWNQYQNRLMAEATAFWNKYKTGKSPMKNQWEKADWISAADFNEYMENKNRFSMLFYRDEGRKLVKPLKPRRSDFPLATNRTKSFDLGEPSIGFTDNLRKIFWNVPENNRACDSARGHPMAQELFRLLKTVVWTTRTGGKIVGNDEYNRDSDQEGGGANYVKDQFGKDKPKPRSYDVANKIYGRGW